MRQKLWPLSLVIFSFICLACGKEEKTNEKLASEENTITTESERHFIAQTELIKAVKNNNTESLREVISSHPEINLNQLLEDGDSLLSHAIKKKYYMVRRILLNSGADPDLRSEEKNSSGLTPLMIASRYGDVSSILNLVEKNADLNLVDQSQDTALHKAIQLSHDEAAITLIRAGADPNKKNGQGLSAWETAIRTGRTVVQNFLIEMARLFDQRPSSATFRAVLESADPRSLKKLLKIYPQLPNEFESMNPIVLVLRSTHETNELEMITTLLEHNAHVDGPPEAETTPLIRAVILKKSQVSELLLKNKANPQVLDRENKSALQYAIENNDYELVHLLLNYGALGRFEIQKGEELISFNACRVVALMDRQLRDPVAQIDNMKIRHRLGCRQFRI